MSLEVQAADDQLIPVVPIDLTNELHFERSVLGDFEHEPKLSFALSVQVDNRPVGLEVQVNKDETGPSGFVLVSEDQMLVSGLFSGRRPESIAQSVMIATQRIKILTANVSKMFEHLGRDWMEANSMRLLLIQQAMGVLGHQGSGQPQEGQPQRKQQQGGGGCGNATNQKRQARQAMEHNPDEIGTVQSAQLSQARLSR